jgi:hypothetical protein
MGSDTEENVTPENPTTSVHRAGYQLSTVGASLDR